MICGGGREIEGGSIFGKKREEWREEEKGMERYIERARKV